jgi:hypothetical protein
VRQRMCWIVLLFPFRCDSNGSPFSSCAGSSRCLDCQRVLPDGAGQDTRGLDDEATLPDCQISKGQKRMGTRSYVLKYE